MAWLSDRTDVFFIWKLMLKSLSEIMPCGACRQHLTQYLNTHPLFVGKNIHIMKGSDIKDRMVRMIWTLHNHVNIRSGKGEYSLEQLNMIYIGVSRSQVLVETHRMLAELYHDWEPIMVKQMTGGHLREWRAHTTLFLSLVAGGPN
jgi:hypothetical protein